MDIKNKILSKKLFVDKKRYYEIHMSIVSLVSGMPLSNKEIEILSAFLSLNSNLTEGGHINSLTRKIVKKQLNLSSSGLSGHLRGIIKKKAVTIDVNRVGTISSVMIPNPGVQGYQILIKSDEKD